MSGKNRQSIFHGQQVNEHDEIRNAKRIIPVDPFGGLQTEGNMALRVAQDSVDSTINYVGKAQIGSAESAEVWQIIKVDGDGNCTWADGDDSFDNIWDDRESLSYL